MVVKEPKKEVSLFPLIIGKAINFKIVGTGYEEMPKAFNPKKGTVHRAIVSCPVCGSTIDSVNLRKLFKNEKTGQRQIAVALHKEGTNGKKYRISDEKDKITFEKAEEFLERKKERLLKEWGLNPVPDEPTPEGKGRGAERAFSVRSYNMNTWGDLFNSRQKLAL